MIENVEPMLRSSREEERIEALRQTIEHKLDIDPVLMTALLGDSSWRVRKEAVEYYLTVRAPIRDHREIVALLHSDDNAGLRNAAMEILVRLGSRAVPALKEEMASDDQDVRKFVVDIMGEIGDETCIGSLIHALQDTDANVRTAAVENLGKIKARDAVPALLDAMWEDDFGWRFTILEALCSIGERISVGPLVPFKNDPLLRKALFDCLGRVGDLDAIDLLIEGLNDSPRKTREAAVVGLARLGENYPAEVTAALNALRDRGVARPLADLLENRDQAVRMAAVEVLGLIGDGSVAERMLPLLADEVCAQTVLQALNNFGDDVLCDMVSRNLGRDADQDIYLVYLAGTGRCAAVAERIISGLTQDDEQMRMVTARSLADIGGPECVAPLVDALRVSSPDLMEVIVDALSKVGTRFPDPVFQAAAALTDDSRDAIRAGAVLIIGRLGGPECHARLSLAFKDESARVRQAALGTLDSLPDEERDTLLKLALTDEDAEVRALAARNLGKWGTDSMVETLAPALADEDLWVRANAVRSLGKMNSATSLALICQALQDPVGLVAIAALETLGDIDGEEVNTALEKALSHPDEEVVKAALQALSGRQDGPWVEKILSGMIDHKRWDVRLAALGLLDNRSVVPFRDILERRLEVEGDDLVQRRISELLTRPAAAEN